MIIRINHSSESNILKFLPVLLFCFEWSGFWGLFFFSDCAVILSISAILVYMQMQPKITWQTVTLFPSLFLCYCHHQRSAYGNKHLSQWINWVVCLSVCLLLIQTTLNWKLHRVPGGNAHGASSGSARRREQTDTLRDKQTDYFINQWDVEFMVHACLQVSVINLH